MNVRSGYIFGILIGLSALAVVFVVWNFLTRTTEVNFTFTIIGDFLLSSGLVLGLFGLYLPKADIRGRIFIVGAIPAAFSGMACLFLGVSPVEVRQKQDWIPLLLALASLTSFQI